MCGRLPVGKGFLTVMQSWSVLPHLEAYYKAWDLPALTPFSVYNSKR